VILGMDEYDFWATFIVLVICSMPMIAYLIGQHRMKRKKEFRNFLSEKLTVFVTTPLDKADPQTGRREAFIEKMDHLIEETTEKAFPGMADV
jgi:hypothetical protein